MIKIEKTEIYGWEAAVRGMRNPMNSWGKSDSSLCVYMDCKKCRFYREEDGDCGKDVFDFIVGDADLELMRKLVAAGTDHSKFMRMITVTADITAPLYWFSEYDTYKVGTVANSCSKMHKLLEKPFEMSDFSFDRLPGYKKEVLQFRPDVTDDMELSEQWMPVDDVYSVSNYGRIRRDLSNGYRILSGSLHKDGYIFVTLHGKQIPLHRLIAKCFHADTYADSLVVNHIDGNKQNNFADNLEWATQQENIRHSYDNLLQPISSKGYTGKFTQEQRDEIKRLWDCGDYSKRELARKYGVSHTCINDIINDKYRYAAKVNLYEDIARPLVDTLNELRDSYLLLENEDERKIVWYSIVQLLPESYNQRRTVQLNYAVLRNIYHSREDHKLDEWKDFCKWIESLPYNELIIDKGDI